MGGMLTSGPVLFKSLLLLFLSGSWGDLALSVLDSICLLKETAILFRQTRAAMGVHSVLQSWPAPEDNVLFPLRSSFVGTLAIFVMIYLVFCLCQHVLFSKKSVEGTAPQLLLPIGKMAQSFFETPVDFLAGGFKATSSSIFRFKLFKNEVTVVSGKAARQTFFQEKSLSLYEGFQVLIGTVG